MSNIKTTIGQAGRLVIPVTFRRKLGINSGDDVILILEEGGIRIVTSQQAIKHAQRMVRRYVPKGQKLSQELIKHRREEAAHD